jgi:hypothetical protein
MRRNSTILIILNVLLLLALIIPYVYLGITYLNMFIILGGLLNCTWVFYSVKLVEKYYQLGERLFIQQFGVKPDKSEMIQRRLSKVDRLEAGASSKAAWMKFWLEKEVYKGIVDLQKEILYMKSPILLPVYAGVSMPVWKETAGVHRNGMPKKVGFYDSKELPHREDYLDKRGNLTKDSWRRLEGVEEYWNPKKQVYERLTL